MKRSIATTAAVLLMGGTMTSCGSSGDGSGSGSSTPRSTKLTVYAAASLTATFTELGKKFEAEHRGVKVSFGFGGSSDLVAQIQQGAPADVFASADSKNMDKAGSAVKDPTNFATNTLEIAVPPDNPAGIASLADLAKPGTKVVLCAAEVPCGSAAATVEQSSGVTIEPVSQEQAVTDVLTKVESGEADAGLVYVTDVRAAGDKVRGITFPESSSAVNTYPIAALARSSHAKLAADFVALVTGGEGQQVLADAGFGRP